MTITDVKKPGLKSRFSFCPQCGRKGVYYIKQQYYRCRYCGAYMISPTEKNNG
jgi:ribosomal protein S27E